MSCSVNVGVSSVGSSAWTQLCVSVGLCVHGCSSAVLCGFVRGEKHSLCLFISWWQHYQLSPSTLWRDGKSSYQLLLPGIAGTPAGSHSCLMHTPLLSQFYFPDHYFSHISQLSSVPVQHSASWSLPQCCWSEMHTVGWQHFQNQTTVVFVKITISLALPAVMTETELLTPH